MKTSVCTVTNVAIVAMLCVLMSPVCYYLYLFPPGGIERTHQIGSQIIEALEQYHEEVRQYPRELRQLTPKYLKEIPKTAWGLGTWTYFKSSDSYELQANGASSINDGVSIYLVYYGHSHRWETGD